jgi:hypothetical protein
VHLPVGGYDGASHGQKSSHKWQPEGIGCCTREPGEGRCRAPAPSAAGRAALFVRQGFDAGQLALAKEPKQHTGICPLDPAKRPRPKMRNEGRTENQPQARRRIPANRRIRPGARGSGGRNQPGPSDGPVGLRGIPLQAQSRRRASASNPRLSWTMALIGARDPTILSASSSLSGGMLVPS